MRLLVVGGGGREHALCWALRRENPGADLYCAPGNPGTAEVATNLDPVHVRRVGQAIEIIGRDGEEPSSASDIMPACRPNVFGTNELCGPA